MENKGPFVVRELRAMNTGQQIFGKFLLLDKVHRKTKDGKDMYNIKLGDASGDIDGVIWENCQIAGEFQAGDVLGLLGDIGNFNGKTQVNVKRLKVLNEDPSTYMKTPLISRSELEKKFEEYLQSIEDSHMSAVLERIFSAEIRPVFFNAAAAKSIHHNYSGGLLEHTLEVADLCMRACPVFPSLNRDMLLTGALLHDIGKIEELEMKVVPQYSVEGRLLGHVVMGTELLTQEINDMRREGLEFSSKLEWMLKHMLLSHHGTLEFGSPVIPLFPEAFLLHMMDNLDAKMFVFFNKIEESGGENELFTNYDNFFGQHFFKYRYNEKKA